jgi:hypothetical protein
MTELTFDELVEKFINITRELESEGLKISRPSLIIKLHFLGYRGKDDLFSVYFTHVDIKDGCLLGSGPVGCGSTPLKAMRDYYEQIRGKRLVFHADDPTYRRECVVV